MSAEQAIEYKNEGNQAFQQKRFQDAVDAFTKAIEINPNDHIFYSNRSAAYASLNKFEEALADSIKCIQIQPDWAKGYSRKGHAEYELGRLTDAVSTYKKGLEIEPENTLLKEKITKIQEELQEEGSGGQYDNIGTQMLFKLGSNPRTAEWLKDSSFMTKLQMLRKSPQMFSILVKQDPRLSEAFNLLVEDFGVGNVGQGGHSFNFQDSSYAGKKKPDGKNS